MVTIRVNNFQSINIIMISDKKNIKYRVTACRKICHLMESVCFQHRNRMFCIHNIGTTLTRLKGGQIYAGIIEIAAKTIGRYQKVKNIFSRQLKMFGLNTDGQKFGGR